MIVPRVRDLSLRATVAISLVGGVLLALSTLYSVDGLKVTPRHTTVAAAAAHVVVDAPESLVGVRPTSTYRMEDFTARASYFGNLIASPPIREDIIRRTGIPADELATRSRLTLNVQLAMRDGDLEQRSAGLLIEHRPYKLELQSDPARPVLNIYTQAPSVEAAEKLADTAVVSLRADLAEKAARDPRDAEPHVVLTQLGPARGGVVNGQITPQMVLLAFLVGFGACFAIAVAARRVVEGWTAAGQPGEVPRRRLASAVPYRKGRPSPEGDWPHTTRVLPWMIAGITAHVLARAVQRHPAVRVAALRRQAGPAAAASAVRHLAADAGRRRPRRPARADDADPRRDLHAVRRRRPVASRSTRRTSTRRWSSIWRSRS